MLASFDEDETEKPDQTYRIHNLSISQKVPEGKKSMHYESYPIRSETYASRAALEHETDSLLSPFKEDVFALGMTFL